MSVLLLQNVLFKSVANPDQNLILKCDFFLFLQQQQEKWFTIFPLFVISLSVETLGRGEGL